MPPVINLPCTSAGSRPRATLTSPVIKPQILPAEEHFSYRTTAMCNNNTSKKHGKSLFSSDKKKAQLLDFHPNIAIPWIRNRCSTASAPQLHNTLYKNSSSLQHVALSSWQTCIHHRTKRMCCLDCLGHKVLSDEAAPFQNTELICPVIPTLTSPGKETRTYRWTYHLSQSKYVTALLFWPPSGTWRSTRGQRVCVKGRPQTYAQIWQKQGCVTPNLHRLSSASHPESRLFWLVCTGDDTNLVFGFGKSRQTGNRLQTPYQLPTRHKSSKQF